MSVSVKFLPFQNILRFVINYLRAPGKSSFEVIYFYFDLHYSNLIMNFFLLCFLLVFKLLLPVWTQFILHLDTALSVNKQRQLFYFTKINILNTRIIDNLIVFLDGGEREKTYNPVIRYYYLFPAFSVSFLKTGQTIPVRRTLWHPCPMTLDHWPMTIDY